jgi:hypothetical protein
MTSNLCDLLMDKDPITQYKTNFFECLCFVLEMKEILFSWKRSLGLLGATPVNRRRVGQEIFPCFEVRRHKGDSPRYGHCKNKGGPKVLPFSGVKACPDFQRTCTSTAKDFFRLRSWKIVGQFLHQTMVD